MEVDFDKVVASLKKQAKEFQHRATIAIGTNETIMYASWAMVQALQTSMVDDEVVLATCDVCGSSVDFKVVGREWECQNCGDLANAITTMAEVG